MGALKEASEQAEQICFFDYVRANPKLEPFIFSIPNEGKRSYVYAKNLVRAGLKKGVSDIFVAIPASSYHGLFIEMKSKKGKPTKYQQEFISNMIKQGYMAIVCYGAEQAINVLNAYLKGNI